MLIQLYQPLNFMGMVYREIKQALVDIEKMFDILSTNAEVKDSPGATPLRVTSGAVRFDNVAFHYMPERPILKGVSFEVPAGKTVAIVGPSGAASRRSRDCCSASTTSAAARSASTARTSAR